MDLTRLSGAVHSVIVSDTDPSVDAPDGWLWSGLYWFEPDERIWRKWNGSGWDEIISPLNTGDTNFTGDVAADGDLGITGSKTVGGFKITFKKGLLTGFGAV